MDNAGPAACQPRLLVPRGRLTLKIPNMMRHYDGGGLSFVDYLAYRRASRAISSRGGGSHTREGE